MEVFCFVCMYFLLLQKNNTTKQHTLLGTHQKRLAETTENIFFFSEEVKKIPFLGIENIVFSRTMNLPVCVKVREMWQYSLDTSYFSHTFTIKSDYLSRGKNACAPSEESDQPAHPRSLIRVLAWHGLLMV